MRFCLAVGQVSLGAGETSAVLRGLREGTDYLVTIIAQYANSIGESVSGKGRTREYWGWSLIYECSVIAFSLSEIPICDSFSIYNLLVWILQSGKHKCKIVMCENPTAKYQSFSYIAPPKNNLGPEMSIICSLQWSVSDV